MSVGLGVSLSNFRVKSQVHKTYSCDIINNEAVATYPQGKTHSGPKRLFHSRRGQNPAAHWDGGGERRQESEHKTFFYWGQPWSIYPILNSIS